MNFTSLSKALPTTENSIAYTHMILFPVGKQTGIRRLIPEALDFRANAFALIIFSTFDVLLSGTRLSLYMITIVPIFLTKRPIFKDFFFSLTTLVKATLAFFHGKHEGLLSIPAYERAKKVEAKDPDRLKHYLVQLPPPANEAETTLLKGMVEKIGVSSYLEFLLRKNAIGKIDEIVELFDAGKILTEVILSTDVFFPENYRTHIFNQYRCTENNFVITVLADSDTSEKIKNNIARLATIQTNNFYPEMAQNQVVEALILSINNLAGREPFEPKKMAYEEARKKYFESLNLSEDDDIPGELPPELQVLEKSFAQVFKPEIEYQASLKGLVSVLNRLPELILSLHPDIFEACKPELAITLTSLNTLYSQNKHEIIAELFRRIPEALAKSTNLETGESSATHLQKSFIMYLLRQQRYNEALILLRHNAENIDPETVVDLLENGSALFHIPQNEMENILAPHHQFLIETHRDYRQSSFKEFHARPIGEKLKTIAIKLFSSEKVTFIGSLLNNRLIKMVSKETPEKRKKLEDIPSINIITAGVELFEAQGKDIDSTNLRNCLVIVDGIPELHIMTKHIIQTLQERNDSETTMTLLTNYAEGIQACNARKQNVVTNIWNRLLGEKLEVFEEDDKKRLESYLLGFKEKIAMQVLPDESHTRAEWGLTLFNERAVEIAKAGEKDYYNGLVPRRAPLALVAFDAHYKPINFIAYLRSGLSNEKNKLGSGVTDVIWEFLSKLDTTVAQALQPLLFDFKDQPTDFCLFCVLLQLGFIEFEEGNA